MTQVSDLKQMLEQQFGPFIREGRYREAFEKSMASMERMQEPAIQIDTFYLFLHHLVIELFSEISRLEQELFRQKRKE